MELSAEIELEKDQEMENYDEICQEDPQLQIIRGKQIEKPEQENNTIEEEMDENKFKLKQQIDLKTLIADETKQYIHMQELKKIMSSSIGKQITKVQETIKQLRRKILEEKNTKHQEGIELHNENSKLLEMKNFTQSTREIVDELKNYVEIMEQQMSKFKFEELEKKALKKIEESSNLISEKICEINKIKNEISFLISEYKAASGQHKCLLDTKLNNLENELERLKNDTNSLLQTNQQLRDEISRIDEELKEKTDEENESSAKIKEVVESKMKVMEDLKSRSLIKQESEYQRNGLITSIESTTTLIDNLTDDVREIEKEELALAIQLRNLQEESHISEGDFNLEDKGLNELEEEEKILTEELEELEKQMAILNRENENLIIMDHEETVTLLKEQNSLDSLRRELLDFQNLKNYKQNEIDELKTQMKTIDEDVKQKSDKQDEAKMEQILLKENKEQLEVALENLQQDLIDKKEQFNYKRYTLQVYLENKLNDMRTRLREINENETKEKKKFSEVEAVIKKKKDQYNRLRNTYLMLKTSSSNSKSPLPKIDQDFSRRENEETLEAEQPSFQTSPKSILKSPAKRSAPTTPTKNVKFFGVSSIASSSSSELVNATSQKCEQLRTNLVERKRTFD